MSNPDTWVAALIRCPKLIDLQASRRSHEALHQQLQNARQAKREAQLASQQASDTAAADAAAERFLDASGTCERLESAVNAVGSPDSRFRKQYQKLVSFPVPNERTLAAVSSMMAARGIQVENGQTILPDGVELVA